MHSCFLIFAVFFVAVIDQTRSATDAIVPEESEVCRAVRTGKPCLFPFIYKGDLYTTCGTNPWNGNLFCATSVHENNTLEYYAVCECITPTTPAPTEPAQTCYSSNSRSCVFPFVYKGKTYDSCTSVDNSGYPWCATSVNGALEFRTWATCICTDPNPGSCTQSGSRFSSCEIPFIFDYIEYKSCTTVNYGDTPWCATSTDRNGWYKNWAVCRCPDPNPSDCTQSAGNSACEFPFVYNGIEYNSCTTANTDNKPWCATATNLDDSYRRWDYCDC